jgi:uncharacterized membrane protein
MNKFFHYLCGIIAIITFLCFGYSLFYPKNDSYTVTITLFFEAIVFTCLFLVVDPKGSEKQQQKGLGMLILTVLSVIVILFMSSCSTSGYGCKGKDSWNKTVRRINRPN